MRTPLALAPLFLSATVAAAFQEPATRAAHLSVGARAAQQVRRPRPVARPELPGFVARAATRDARPITAAFVHDEPPTAAAPAVAALDALASDGARVASLLLIGVTGVGPRAERRAMAPATSAERERAVAARWMSGAFEIAAPTDRGTVRDSADPDTGWLRPERRRYFAPGGRAALGAAEVDPLPARTQRSSSARTAPPARGVLEWQLGAGRTLQLDVGKERFNTRDVAALEDDEDERVFYALELSVSF